MRENFTHGLVGEVKRKGHFRCSGAFTLVELLVVIAIISVLAGMLMPALENAIDSAYAIKCTNNLKQMHLGWSSYYNEYNGYMIASYTYNSSSSLRTYWVDTNMEGTIDNYVGSMDAFLCPSNDLEPYNSRLKTKYPINQILAPSNVGGGSTWWKNISAVKYPMATLVFIDSNDRGVGACRYNANATTHVGFIHNEKSNLIMVDGHSDGVFVTDVTPADIYSFALAGYSFSLDKNY